MGLAIVLLFVLHALQFYPSGDGRLPFLTRLDNILYDKRLNLTMPGGVDPSVVILDIDEKSLGEIGHWPWSRSLMAELIAKLFDRYGVEVLGFDIVWAERDTSSGIDALDALARNSLKQASGFQAAYKSLRPGLDYDELFAKAMRGRPVVLGYYFSNEDGAARVNAIPEPVLPPGSFAGRNVRFPKWVGFTGNLPAYLESAAAAGHFNPLVDEDGVSRRVPMLLEYEGRYYESLSLAMVRTYIALHDHGRFPAVEPGYPQVGGRADAAPEWLKVGPLRIPVDESAAALIPYRGKRHSFPYLPLADVVKDRVDPGALKGKIVLVGASAHGLYDLRSTPVDSVFPGVEIHANLVAGMLGSTIKEKPAFMAIAEVLLLLAGGVTLAILIPLLSALWATLAAAGGLALVGLFNVAVWTRFDMALPLAASVAMIAVLYVMNMAYGYFVESRSKRLLAERFGEYVPPELVDRMAANPAKYNMEPRSAELTILFADVRGFTGISETLKPEELREYINEYLTGMSTIIRSRYRGTLDKYIGDAVMAFWGAPVEDPQHARDAVLAALEMQRDCEALNAKFAARGWPALKIGVGVNSGIVRVGDMGSQVRRAYTAMGDAVNVASRIEGRTKSYAVGILAGEATRERVKDVVFREVDRIKVMGRDEAVTVYEPLGLESEIGESVRRELQLWNSTLRAYRTRQWDDAETGLGSLARMNPACGLYRVYAAIVADKRRNPPPPQWDGVTAFDEK
ncbi:MAG TPA: adenylate/guanylate cyclase domain-containing protein [Burkholderiales bacterium]|jgi:adenylate cyclase